MGGINKPSKMGGLWHCYTTLVSESRYVRLTPIQKDVTTNYHNLTGQNSPDPLGKLQLRIQRKPRWAPEALKRLPGWSGYGVGLKSTIWELDLSSMLHIFSDGRDWSAYIDLYRSFCGHALRSSKGFLAAILQQNRIETYVGRIGRL